MGWAPRQDIGEQKGEGGHNGEIAKDFFWKKTSLNKYWRKGEIPKEMFRKKTT